MGIFYSENWLADLAKLATAISSGAVASYAFVRWWIPRRRQDKNIKRAFRGLAALSRSLSSMEDVVHQKAIADRAIVLAAHNHGGLPHPGRPFFVSAIHACARTKEMTDIIDTYKDMPVDAAYTEMIIDVFTNGFVLLDVETMKPGMLKKLYELEKVGQSLIIKLGFCDNSLVYMSYAKLQSSGGFRPNEITLLKLMAAEIARKML